jgi:hypothetical protein
LITPVQGRREQVVGPPREHVADVHHEGARDRLGVDPAPGGVADLQAALVVLGQQRQAAVVGVRAGPDAGLVDLPPARGGLGG